METATQKNPKNIWILAVKISEKRVGEENLPFPSLLTKLPQKKISSENRI